MKKLKFKSNLVQKILDGQKTVTWRLFDEKNLSTGDQLELLDSESGQKFAEAEITEVREKKLGQIEDADFEGHEKYESKEDMMKHYREYYGEGVTPDVSIKIITFKILRFLS